MEHFSTACTDVGGQSNNLCEWNPQTRKIVKAADANEMFPDLVVAYLESNFNILDDVPLTLDGLNGKFQLTRQLRQWAVDQKVHFDPKVVIVRNIDLDKWILNRASAAPINLRRATVQKVVNIPFGARGRKRQTNNIAYIGIQPNPDGRILTPSNIVPSTSNATQNLRTYARAKSFPGASSTMPTQDDSTPPQTAIVQPPVDSPASQTTNAQSSNDISLVMPSGSTTTNASSDSTFDFDSFDLSYMGRLKAIPTENVYHFLPFYVEINQQKFEMQFSKE